MASRRQSSRDYAAESRPQLLAAQLNNPPLPHQSQPHYYGLPDPDIGLPTTSRLGVKPGERGYYCGFDTIQTTVASTAQNLVLVGSEGALDIYKSERAELSRVGHLEGLRGAVIEAKFLTWPSRQDPFAVLRPLVALAIHGPINSPDLTDDVLEDKSEIASDQTPVDYQTSIEVYSLASKSLVATLYTSPKVRVSESLIHPQFVPPPPIGDLRIEVSSRFVTVASGTSGEIYVFTPTLDASSSKRSVPPFRCLGKFWTSIERCFPRDKSSTGAGEVAISSASLEKRVPVYSLSGRWLVTVPPTSSAQSSIQGSPLLAAANDRPPGLNHFTAPGPPLVDCLVESPDQESILNRMTRVATQEMIKGAQWVGTQGLQAWRNYWAKPSQAPELGAQYPAPDAWFPPTHADSLEAQDDGSGPTLVSVIDLDRLLGCGLSAKALEPLGTFEAPGGCSCVSLSPSGLHLLTVSHRGETQRVWDLMRLRPGQLGAADATRASKPIVRQVAKFQRLTNAHVVEVVWSEPKGDKLAIVTHRGTVHLFEVPPLAFQWPPRAAVQKRLADETKRLGSETGAPAPQPGFIPAKISSFNDTVRKQASGLSTLTSNLNIAHGRGRKAVASGVTKSFGAAAEGLGQLIHLGDNKLRLEPGSSPNVSSGCVRFLTGSSRGYVGLLSGGTLRVHAMPQLDRKKSPGKSAASKDIEFPLPHVKDEHIAPAARQLLKLEEGNAAATSLSGFWHLSKSRDSPDDDDEPQNAQPLSFAEIETSSPFQPFQADRRVTLSTFTDDRSASGQGRWAFGAPIPSTVVHAAGISSARAEDDEALRNEDLLSADHGVYGVDEDGFEVLDADSFLSQERHQQLI